MIKGRSINWYWWFRMYFLIPPCFGFLFIIALAFGIWSFCTPFPYNKIIREIIIPILALILSFLSVYYGFRALQNHASYIGNFREFVIEFRRLLNENHKEYWIKVSAPIYNITPDVSDVGEDLDTLLFDKIKRKEFSVKMVCLEKEKAVAFLGHLVEKSKLLPKGVKKQAAQKGTGDLKKFFKKYPNYTLKQLREPPPFQIVCTEKKAIFCYYPYELKEATIFPGLGYVTRDRLIVDIFKKDADFREEIPL